MYDALEDCPVEFINKLIQTLNSLGETMGVEPTQTFDKVLCNVNDNNEETRKKLYNWWRGVFEVLGSCKNSIPKDREDEFNEKVDALMAEILKSGDGQNTAEEEPEEEEGGEEEVMLEEYEPADKEDETNMLTDMKWAVGKIGEIANRVQELINFVNPYCEVNESMMDNKPARYSIGDHVIYKGEECVVIDVDEDLQNDEEIYQVSRDSDKVDGLSFNDWVTWDEIELINGFEKEDKSKMKREKTIWKEIRRTSQDDWVDAGEVFEMAKESDLENELDRGDDGWVEIGQPVGESKPVELEGTDDCSNNVKFKPIGQMNEASVAVGDVVSWKDENDEMQDGWTVVGYDEISLEYHLKKDGKDVWVDDVRVEEYNESNVAAEQKMVELEGTDWKDLTEKLTAVELADSIDGWEDRSKKLVVCDAYASGSDIVNVDVLTVTDKRDEVMTMANDYLLGNVENWQVADASEPRKDENGQFYTELILEPKYEEVSENNDEVKTGDVKDGEKQVTQDGETKTLVAGEENKKPVCEMTIEEEITNPWNLAEFLWGQGKENLEELLRTKFVEGDAILQLLEDMGIRNLTNINDLFAYDFPSVLDSLGLDGHAWNQNLEFKRKGGEDEEDEGEDED